MKTTISILFSLLFPLLLIAQNKAKTPLLGYYDKVYLGMTAGEVEQAYNCKVEKTESGIIFNASKYNIETSFVKINLEEIGKVYKLGELLFPEMHLEFINKILVQIKFIANEEYLKDEEEAKKIVNYNLKGRYAGQYKGCKEYAPPSNVSNDFTRSVNFSAQEFISQMLGSEAQWNVHFKDVPSNEANLLRFSYAIKAPRKIKKPYYGGKITLQMRYNDEINYWKLFVEIMKKSHVAELKPINTFRNKNLGMSLVAFKETYASILVPQESQKVLNQKYAPYVEIYTLSDENLSLLDQKLEGIYYIFYEDKLQQIRILFDKILPQEEFNALAADIKTVFGKPSFEDDNIGLSATHFWSDDHIIKNFGEAYYASLREKLGEIPEHHFAMFNLFQTNSNKDIPTTISILLSGFYTKLDNKDKQDNKKTLQNDF
ncbi:hypothetical protein ACUNWD_05100 [Sunxiuqinia sp. A32]|uniref:hypothetical protein n=1 Tax=Sunxiuqinia sp. A32 TaxID=3461496 RepID=UPI00404522BF